MLRVPDPRTLQGKRDYVILLTPLTTGTLLAIKDYLKATGSGIETGHPLFQTLGKHGPYEGRDLTPKAIDCLIKAVAKNGLLQKRVLIPT